MKKNILISFILIFVFLEVTAQNEIQKFADYAEKSFKKWDLPSVSIAIVQDGKIVYSRSFGHTDWSKKEKTNVNTLYPVGSISKSFTALALAQLVDKGLLTWDTHVKDVVPDFKLYDDYVTMNATIEDLVCHRLGFDTFSGDLLWYHTKYSVDDIIRRIQYLKPVYDFRNGYGYSNLMFMVAGKVIENVTGMKFEDYVKENILLPLDMKRSTYQIDDLPKIGNFAKGTYLDTDLKHRTIEYIPSHNIQAFGGLNSSVEEMANYMIMLMNSGEFKNKNTVSSKQIDYLWKMHNPIGVDNYTKQLHPERHFYGYGLGWFVYDKNGYKIVTHDGGMDGALSRLLMIPEKKTGIIILTNGFNLLYVALGEYFADLFTDNENPFDWNNYYLNVFPRYLNSYVDMKNQHVKIEGTKPSLPIDDYYGVYTDKMYGNVKVISENGVMKIHFEPAPYLDAILTHWHYNTFEMKFVNPNMAIPTSWGLAKFEINEDGKIDGLKLIVPNYDFLFNELSFKKTNKNE